MVAPRIEYRPYSFPREFDGVVATSGKRDFATPQAADGELDAAAYSLYVKQGTYSAGLTASTNNVHIFIEPGTIIQAGITLSGTDITLLLGAGCDIQGVVTLSGANCQLICHNGVDLDGVTMSGVFSLFDGGGWDTFVDGGTANHAVSITAPIA